MLQNIKYHNNRYMRNFYIYGIEKLVIKHDWKNIESIFISYSKPVKPILYIKYYKPLLLGKNPLQVVNINDKYFDNNIINNFFDMFRSLRISIQKQIALFCKPYMLFHKVHDILKQKFYYNAANGCYGILLNIDIRKRKVTIRLPSGKKLLIHGWLLLYKNRNYNSELGSITIRNMNDRKRKKKLKVRGVAQNVVDHGNGGNARKNLFVNKYGNIAKANK